MIYAITSGWLPIYIFSPKDIELSEEEKKEAETYQRRFMEGTVKFLEQILEEESSL